MTSPMPDAFVTREFTHDGVTRPVFIRGDGTAIVIMHEVPGHHPAVIEFGRYVSDAGYTVWMPSLLGTPGEAYSRWYNARSMTRACIAREFTVWATRRNSAITVWLRALARHAHERCGGPGVGALGMCLTGGFALAMMVDDILLAPVLSQPSLPAAVTRAQKQDLGIDDETLSRVKARTSCGTCVMGLRFTHDPLVPEERFQRLRDELGDKFIAIEIDSGPGNPHGFSRLSHSVLGLHFVDAPGHPTLEARSRVMEFFDQRLRAA